MKKQLLFICTFLSAFSYSQAPFTTTVRVPRYVEKQNGDEGKYSYVMKNHSTLSAVAGKSVDEVREEAQINSFGFFNNSSLSVSLISDGNNRASISSDVISYKLFFAEPKEDDATREYRYNIPLSIISKLSTEYDTTNSATSLDVLDYEAAPVTMRIMPSDEVTLKNVSDLIYVGFYADVRGLNLYNAVEQNNKMEFVGSSGIGFTYQSNAEATRLSENGQVYPGTFSLSLILQGAIGKKEVLDQLFIVKKDYVGSLQTYLNISIREQNGLSLKIGYQYLFQETISGSKSNFSIALGI